MKHIGEAIRLMSGKHGTLVINDGDEYPQWYSLVSRVPTKSASAMAWHTYAASQGLEGHGDMTKPQIIAALTEGDNQ